MNCETAESVAHTMTMDSDGGGDGAGDAIFDATTSHMPNRQPVSFPPTHVHSTILGFAYEAMAWET